MQFVYGPKMPLRILDEAEFWKRQEAEHTVVIRELVPNLEPRFVDALRAWEDAFAQTEGVVRRYLETVIRLKHPIPPAVWRQVLALVDFALRQSKQFVAFLGRLSMESEAIRALPVAIVVLNHIRRESEYFIGIAQTILVGKWGRRYGFAHRASSQV